MTGQHPTINITANQGEWSELYVLVYLLGTGRLDAADAELRPLPDQFFPILKIMRNENEHHQVDMLVHEHGIDILCNGHAVNTVKRSVLISYTRMLLDKIRTGKSSFSIPAAQEIMDNLSICKVKASSREKADISMMLHDIHTGIENVFSFSIKSYMGNLPTLLNASKSTNFIFTVSGLPETEVAHINAIDGTTKLLDRIHEIEEHGGTLSYVRPASSVFHNNLALIDSTFDRLIAAMLLESFRHGEVDCHTLLDILSASNPLHVPNSEVYYPYKFKKFLCAVALGMQPAKPWSGREEASGGYIIARTDGVVVAYHIYNRDFFEEYLLCNTKLERASSARHEYCTIYRGEDGGLYLNLNLQIRFKASHG